MNIPVTVTNRRVAIGIDLLEDISIAGMGAKTDVLMHMVRCLLVYYDKLYLYTK